MTQNNFINTGENKTKLTFEKITGLFNFHQLVKPENSPKNGIIYELDTTDQFPEKNRRNRYRIFLTIKGVKYVLNFTEKPFEERGNFVFSFGVSDGGYLREGANVVDEILKKAKEVIYRLIENGSEINRLSFSYSDDLVFKKDIKEMRLELENFYRLHPDLRIKNLDTLKDDAVVNVYETCIIADEDIIKRRSARGKEIRRRLFTRKIKTIFKIDEIGHDQESGEDYLLIPKT